jgi:transposase, IS605 OrfB family, central region
MKQLTLWEFACEPSDDGKQTAISPPSKRRQVKDGTTSKSSSKRNQSQTEDAPLLSMLASLLLHKRQTLIDKLNDYQRSTQALKSLRKWEEDSILGGKDSSIFWDEFCEVISQLLWLPTKTDLQDSGSTLSNGSVSNLTAKSWFSTKSVSLHTPNSFKISSQSSTVFQADFTPLGDLKTKSSRSYKSNPRHKKEKKSPNKTLKIRVYPELVLHQKWKSWLSASRYCYNKAIAALKAGEKITSAYSLRDYVLGLNLPDWVKSAPSHPKENAIFDAWDAWKQAKSVKGEANFRSCRQPSQSIKFHKVNFNGETWFPSLVKGLNFRTTEPIQKTEFATQLVRDKKRWFACIPVTEEARTKELDQVIALDPGVRTFLTGYDGDSFQEFGKADIGRIQRLCSHLDKLMGRASKAVRKQKRRMLEAASKLRIRIRDLVDECHKQVVNYLTSQYKVILLPTFETSQMVVKSKRKLRTKTARQMLTWGHYRFECHLKQSAKKRGVVVIDVNESYTSKTCTKCGHKHSKLGGSKTFKCPNCGHEHDRDWGGARNIMIRALRDGYESSLYQ